MLEKLLTPTERAAFDALVDEAAQAGHQALQFHSDSGVLIIALLAAGRLETWFATPARNPAEVIAARAIVFGGLEHACDKLAGIMSGANAMASDAIRRAAH